MKTTYLYNRRNPTNANAQRLKAQSELKNAYQKEKIEFIQNQINKIRDLVEGRQSRISWQTENGNRRKSTARDKLKAASQEE